MQQSNGDSEYANQRTLPQAVVIAIIEKLQISTKVQKFNKRNLDVTLFGVLFVCRLLFVCRNGVCNGQSLPHPIINLFHAITSLPQNRSERDKGTKGQMDKGTKGQTFNMTRNLLGQKKLRNFLVKNPLNLPGQKKSHNLLELK